MATKAHGSQAPPSQSQDETIHTTEKHPWLTTDRGWVTAGDLHVGEQVVELGGRTATITALAVHAGTATYYNLTVSKLHTYAVGASRAVVHNTNRCVKPDPDLTKRAKNAFFKLYDKSAGRKGFVVALAKLSDGQVVGAINESAWGLPGMTREAVQAALGSDVKLLDDPALLDAAPLDDYGVGYRHAEQYIGGYTRTSGLDFQAAGTSWADPSQNLVGFCRACQGLLDSLP